MKKLLILSIALLVLIVGGMFGYEKYQDYKLDAWAQNVSLSANQKEALWSLWTSYQAGKAERITPLKNLTREELKHLHELSIPSELARKKTFSYSKFNRLKEMGFDVDERSVIMAMEINHIGRKDLFR